ncbi:MAG: glycosyltransferase family 39 protein [Candidatus Goldbacteria bacterium]|nr:glycosyltransferase family 39 protein [Candidatus Goldiibacteriota bacterium]
MLSKYKDKNKRLTGIFFAVLSVFFAFTGQYFLFNRINLLTGLLFFLIAVILFLLFDQNDAENKKTGKKIELKTEIFLFFIIFLAGIFFRIYDLKNSPPGFFQDEALASMDALSILRGEKVLFQETSLPVYIKGQVDNPALILYLVAFVFKFFGVGVMQARIASAVIPGILAIPAFYFLCRYIFGIRFALLCTFLFSVMRWHVIYSRFFFHASFCVLIIILFLYFFIKSYKERKWIDFILMGFLLGLTQHTYQPVKLVLAWVVIFYAYIYFKEKNFFAKNYKKIITAFLITLVVITPLLFHIKSDYKDYFRRIRLLSVFNKDNPENFINGRYSLVQVLFNNTAKTLLMFNYKGDENVRHNYSHMPMLDFVTGTFAFMGFGYLLIRGLLPLPFLILSFFVFSLLGSILNVAAPHATRTITAIPAVLIFAGYFLEKNFAFLDGQKNKLKYVCSFFIIATLICCGFLNYKDYFNSYCRQTDIWDSFASDQVEAAKYLISLGDDYQAVTALEYCVQYYKSAPFVFMMKSKNRSNFECFNLQKHVPINRQSEKNFVYLFPAGYETITGLLKRIYPDGTYKPFYKKYNEKSLSHFAYEVKNKDIKNPQIKDVKCGLTGYFYNGEWWKGKLMDKRNDYFIFIHNDPAVVSGVCSIKWKGKISIQKDGIYQFQGESEDDVYWDIMIDDKIAAESPAVKGKIFDRKNVFLKQGVHKIEIRCSSYRDIQKIKMFWKTPDGEEPPVIVPAEVFIPEM